MRLARSLLLLALTAGAIACDSGPTEGELPEGVLDAVRSITASDLRARVEVLADDSMRGRPTPSPELMQAARYVAAEFAGAGLRSGSGADFLQWYSTSGSPGEPPPGPVPQAQDAVNVIGWIEGADPVRRHQYVVITAHVDHVGVGTPVDGDSIYNGADDNASGTAAVLELAEAFGRLPRATRRSLVFIAFSGEERGLLGSEHYVENPAFPLEGTVAALNLDMVGRNWPDTVVAIRTPDSTIGPTAERVAEEHPELGMGVIDDRWPGQNLLFRSDQYHFHRMGVPVLFFTSGLHEDYHRPSDEADRLDYEKTARLTRLLFYITRELAEAAAPPE